MQTFTIHNATINFQFIDENNFIIIVADANLIGTFTIMFNEQQFLDFLDENNIMEVQGNSIVWDAYVEDDEGITQTLTYPLAVSDYVTNYITRDVVEKIIHKVLAKFNHNFDKQ